MGNTPHFAFNVVACAVLAIMLWAACAGIGYRIVPGPSSASDDEPASWHQPGVAACVGLALLVALGGVAVALRIPWWLVVAPFLVIGLVLAIREVSRVDRRGWKTATWVIGGVAAAALLLVALAEAPIGLRFPLNVCDDWRAYLPMAHRLLDTNGLTEAWSARRLQSLGGFTFLQALPVSLFGNAGIGVAETVIAAVFLAGLFIANGVRSTWARLLSIALILSIPLLWVPRVNTTGVLIGSPLLVAVLAATVELRRALRDGHRGAAFRWAAAAGIVIAMLSSVRPNLGFLAALLLALGALFASNAKLSERLQTIAIGGISTLAAIAPWSIASWQSSRTPFSTLFTGNQNLVTTRTPPLHGVSDLAQHAYDLLRSGPYSWIVLAVLVLSIAVRKSLPDAPFLAIAAVATGAGLVALALYQPISPPRAYLRYIAPMTQGLVVFCACEVIRGADVCWRRESTQRSRVGLVVAVAAAVGIFALGHSVIAVSPRSQLWPGGADLVERAARNELSSDVAPASLRTQYRRALAGADPNRTIAAVERPYLIDYERYDVPSMDFPGFTAPGATFPFFTGAQPKIDKLRREGYRTLVITAPGSDACLNVGNLQHLQSAAPESLYGRFSRYVLDWYADMATIKERAPGAVRVVGTLWVIDLPRAQRELSAERGG